MRNCFFAICILGISYLSHAQGQPADWGKLNTLHAGDKIQVSRIKSKKVTGAFVNASDATLSLQTGASLQRIPKQEIQSVKLVNHKHRLRNTLVAAGVGAGVGAGIGAATYHSCSGGPDPCIGDIGGRGLPAGIGAAVGGLAGAIVGAVLPSLETIYELKSP
jgi:hypothetical protein